MYIDFIGIENWSLVQVHSFKIFNVFFCEHWSGFLNPLNDEHILYKQPQVLGIYVQNPDPATMEVNIHPQQSLFSFFRSFACKKRIKLLFSATIVKLMNDLVKET